MYPVLTRTFSELSENAEMQKILKMFKFKKFKKFELLNNFNGICMVNVKSIFLFEIWRDRNFQRFIYYPEKLKLFLL